MIFLAYIYEHVFAAILKSYKITAFRRIVGVFCMETVKFS